MAVNKYDYGDLIRVTGTFTDEDGVATDPAVVKLTYQNPAGTETTVTYPDAAITKSGTGVYYADIDANAVGAWSYRWWSTGSGQASGEKVFVVNKSEFS